MHSRSLVQSSRSLGCALQQKKCALLLCTDSRLESDYSKYSSRTKLVYFDFTLIAGAVADNIKKLIIEDNFQSSFIPDNDSKDHLPYH
jgi:hypothetical protein